MVYFPAFEVETKNQLDIYDQSKKQNVRIKQSKDHYFLISNNGFEK